MSKMHYFSTITN